MNNKKNLKEIFRFLLVGCSSTLLDYAIYWPLSCSISPHVAKTVSIVCSCVYAFFLNKKFTFQCRNSIKVSVVIRFILSQLANISVNIGTNAILLALLHSKLQAMLLATVCATIVNFLLQKYFVFHTED